nr:hypothetical protein [uncultured Carboxylicivirga sp.]
MKKSLLFGMLLAISMCIYSQSFDKEKLRLTYLQYPYCPLLDSTATYKSNSFHLVLHGCKQENPIQYQLTATPFRSFKHYNNWSQELMRSVSPVTVVSDVSEFKIINQQKEVLYYRVFNTFYSVEVEKFDGSTPKEISSKQGHEISEHFSRLALKTNRIFYVSIFTVKKGDGIDDVKEACEASLEAAKAYQQKQSNTLELLQEAIALNKVILSEADFENKKSRINKKVADPVLRNQAQLKVLADQYTEAKELCKQYIEEIGGFKGLAVGNFIPLCDKLADNQSFKTSETKGSFLDYEFPKGTLETPTLEKSVEDLSNDEVINLLYGSWRITNSNEVAQKDEILHFTPNKKVLQQTGDWENTKFQDPLNWIVTGQTKKDKNIVTAFDTNYFNDYEENQELLNFFKIKHISKDKLIVSAYNLKILPDSEVSYTTDKNSKKLGGFGMGQMKSNKYQMLELGDIEMDRIQIRE